MRAFLLLALWGLAQSASPVCADPEGWWKPTEWPYRIKITFDNPGDRLEHFPVTVRLDATLFARPDATSSPLKWSSLRGGAGIRFLDADNRTELAWERAWWSASDRKAELHVRVPRIDATSKTDFIYLYLGSRVSSSQPAPRQVWSTHYEAVYHLNRSNGRYVDSTGRHPSIRVKVTHRANRLGVAGNPAPDFDGQGSYIDLGNWNVIGAGKNNDGITLEAFFQTDVLADRRLICKSEARSGASDRVEDQHHTWMLNFIDKDSDGTYRLRYRQRTSGHTDLLRVDRDLKIDIARWYHAAATYDGRRMALYQDGVLAAQMGKAGTIDVDRRPIYLGANPGSRWQYFDGRIDEVRISRVARSRSWLAATSAGLHGRFCSFGPLERRPNRSDSSRDRQHQAARAQLERGRTLEAEGKYYHALLAYQKAARLGAAKTAKDAAQASYTLLLDPRCAAALEPARLLARGARDQTRGRSSEAAETFRRLLKAYPDSPQAAEARRRLRQLGR